MILRQTRFGFHAIEGGVLSFDGETLTLGEVEACREFSDRELELLLDVSEGNRIRECRGFDFFVLAQET